MIGLFLSIVFHICLLDAVNSQKSSILRKGRNEFFIYPIYTIVISALFVLTSTTMTARFSIEFKHRLTNVLVDKYLEYNQCRDSRRFVDQLHVHYSCCGIESFDDFIDLSNIEGYDKELAPQTQINSCSNWEYCSLPLSCCKSALCTNIGELFNKPRNSTKISIEFYHQKGCLAAISETFLFLKKSTWHIILLSFVIVLHVVAGFLIQLTLTGYASLKESGLSEDEDSYSWILDFGAPLAEEYIELIKDEKSSSSENQTTKRENDLDTEKGYDNRLSESENLKRSDLENDPINPIKKDFEKNDDEPENKENLKNPSETAINAKKMIGKISDKIEKKLESNKEGENDLTSCGPSRKNDTKTSKSTERESKNRIKKAKNKTSKAKPKKKGGTKKKTQPKKAKKGETKKKEKKEPKKSRTKGKKK